MTQEEWDAMGLIELRSPCSLHAQEWLIGKRECVRFSDLASIQSSQLSFQLGALNQLDAEDGRNESQLFAGRSEIMKCAAE